MKTYTIADIAEKLGTSLRVVRRLVASGELKSEKKGTTYSISEDEFLAYCQRKSNARPIHYDLFGGEVVDDKKQQAKASDNVNWADISRCW